VVQERDGLGDRVPPDYLVQPQKGAFYGWPFAYIGQNRLSKVPGLLFEARLSAMDIVFYKSATDVRTILDSHYLHRDPELAESALRKLERSGTGTNSTN
jgi:hypothetical protein